MIFTITNQTKAGQRNGMYRYRTGSSWFGCLRDGMGHPKLGHGTERNRGLVPVYHYRFIPIYSYSGSGPVRSGSGPVPIN